MEFVLYLAIAVIIIAAISVIIITGAFEACVPKKWGVVAIIIFVTITLSGTSLCSGRATYFQMKLLPTWAAIVLLILSAIVFAIMLKKKIDQDMEKEDEARSREVVVDRTYYNNLG